MAGFPQDVACDLATYLRDGRSYNVAGRIADRLESGLSQDLGDRFASSITNGLQEEVASMLGHHLSDRLVSGIPRVLAALMSRQLTYKEGTRGGLKALQTELATGMKEPIAGHFVNHLLNRLPNELQEYYKNFGSQGLWPVTLNNLTLWHISLLQIAFNCLTLAHFPTTSNF